VRERLRRGAPGFALLLLGLILLAVVLFALKPR
jgi:cbb3-type cytochrome oxidase subunit 3